jgi:hypothetical protein
MKLARVFILLVILIAPLLTRAEGRYQVIPLLDSSGGFGPEKVVIIDTVAGHMWIWTESPANPVDPGGRYLIYQGKLRPGNTMGEIIYKQEWGSGPGRKSDKPMKKRR